MSAVAGMAMFDKIWDRHVVIAKQNGPSLLYIDRDMIHEGSFHAFADLRRRGLRVRKPNQVFGTADHYAPTSGRAISDAATPQIARMIEQFDDNMRWGGVHHFGLSDPRQGIVHVVGPEQGITLPGLTIVCSDSHTSTQGALGAIAFGIGQSENAHVMATQTLWQVRPKTMRITIDGVLAPGVHSKDVILAIIGKIGAGGAGGHAIEYAGSAIRSMSIEQRLTICNMSIEAAARCGMVAPDDTTFEYIYGRPFAPRAEDWDDALAFWRTLPTDEDASFDREVVLAAEDIQPMVTWGTSPEDVLPISAHVPDPAGQADVEKRETMARALNYMGLEPGTPLSAITIDRVFIGSCTNGRIEDLRAAAAVLKGQKAKVPGFVSPGSTVVKRAAEAEGLDRIFKEAGLEWRESGCSMCSAMNGDQVNSQERCASTSNRNFVGRQGPGARTHLVSPAMAAAAAVTGRLTDVRQLMSGDRTR
ncbi:3-isopropylmalate dehydratase large subunit [Limoniibacter endophyticus]|uniref:3-isopropylmalate dehydratase large subunit n=1 Tax=Limoniibacter endophyticus TaxID=1565040 RepID=A0A8J3DM28_9HYPH|nr:3-isopropylmalate dehydratase large subunit [Limoniibacter endophyticus]GHC66292.1 3-isopropylmalate dehydratase large subunit [Limoniibacter endophyticus]